MEVFECPLFCAVATGFGTMPVTYFVAPNVAGDTRALRRHPEGLTNTAPKSLTHAQSRGTFCVMVRNTRCFNECRSLFEAMADLREATRHVPLAEYTYGADSLQHRHRQYLWTAPNAH